MEAAEVPARGEESKGVVSRFDKAHIERVARDFAASRFADVWHLFGADIHNAMIDAHIMNELRHAWVADSTATYTATEIVEFRNAVATRLADPKGVMPAHRRCGKSRYVIEE